jgi:hypothetical protein
VSAADRRHRPLLRVDIEPRRAGLRDEQRPGAVAREPYAVARFRTHLPFELLDDLQQLAGGIGGQGAPHQHPGGRIEQREVLLEAGPQSLRRKMPGHHRRTQQVAVAPEIVAVALGARLLAVGHRDEALVPAQRLCELAARLRQRAGGAALDSNQNQPRYDAVAQLIHQHLLPGRRRARQESRDVCRDRSARNDRDAGGEKDQPRGQSPAHGFH